MIPEKSAPLNVLVQVRRWDKLAWQGDRVRSRSRHPSLGALWTTALWFLRSLGPSPVHWRTLSHIGESDSFFSLVNFVLPQPNVAVLDLDLVLLILSQETWSVSSAMGLRLHIKPENRRPCQTWAYCWSFCRQAHARRSFRLEERRETNIFNLV